MNKKIFTFFATSLLMAGMIAGISAQTFSSGETDVKIAVVFSTGGLGDKSFNDAANLGLQNAITKYNLSTDQYATTEPKDVAEINTAIEGYAADGSYDLIIAIGFSSAGGVEESAKAHPNQKFMIVDSVVDLPNVASVVFKEHEGSFLAGAMAAMVSETGKIAFLGGLDIPLINKFLAGYQQGAKYINSDIIVSYAYAPNPDNPWNDVDGGKTVANQFISDGADIVYAAAGATGEGVFNAVGEARDSGKTVYAIGVDSNQDYLLEGGILTSMVKRVDVAVETQIDAIVDGTWAAGLTSLGLKEDGVGITEMEFTQDEANAIYEGSTTRMQKIEEIKADIIAGTIVVSEVPDTDVQETEEAPVPLSIAPVFLGMIAVIFVVRRKKLI